jgi:putative transposase
MSQTLENSLQTFVYGYSECFKKKAMPIWNWSLTISQLAILFDGRLDESLNL